MPFLDSRSEGAIEYKHQNVSAVLIDLGMPYIRGYKPAFNYQGLLASVVETQVNLRQSELINSVDRQIECVPERVIEREWDAILEAKPEREDKEPIRNVREYRPRQYNYAEREARNRRLGYLGEEFILHMEKQRLARLGREDLAREVEWTSKVCGDGAGYDIRSFNAAMDQELYIEVKTTNAGKFQPFMITDNEVAFSEERASQYSLYRVFQFKDDPRIFTLDGSIREQVNLLVRGYTVTFR